MKKIFIIGLILLYSACKTSEEALPNIVWLISEDNSTQHMQLYHEGGASMPNIEKLAEKGIVYNNAFSNAPVCSVARSTLITGCYAPRLFTQFHRRMEFANLPEDLKPFPYYLKQAGYYTSNSHKQDYNFILPEGVWDESSKEASYKNRNNGQPFFHIQSHNVSHEGSLHFDQNVIDQTPDEDLEHIKVFPYHPDTKTFRYSYQHFQNRHIMVDKLMGELITDLEKEGLMEETIIFYFGDHGGALPRSKGYAYESGLQVPLVVYIPKKWEHLFNHKKGSRSDTFVEFVDFGPTVLSLAGIAIPSSMDGTAILGKFAEPLKIQNKNSAFGHADRFDEKYDLVRTLRVGNYKYIRNYQPFNVDGLYNFYRYKMLAYKEWRSLYRFGKLNQKQKQFFEFRSAEALYDLDQDPHEVNDLSSSTEHQEILVQMRDQLREKLLALPDLSFYPEPFLLENALKNPVDFGLSHRNEIQELLAVADLNLFSFEEAEQQIKKALANKNPWKRYWGLIACSSFGIKAKSFLPKIQDILNKDQVNLVRFRALEYLMLNQKPYDSKIIKELLRSAKSKTEANLMLNSLALIKSLNPTFKIDSSKEIFPTEWYEKENDLVNRRMDYLIYNL